MSANRIKHVFLNSDMRCGHRGLMLIARHKAKVKPGEHVVFVNSKRDKMKVLSAGGVLSYVCSPRGKLSLETVQSIPAAFKVSGGFDYGKALKDVIVKKLEKHQ